LSSAARDFSGKIHGNARGKHRRDLPMPAMPPYPPESWAGTALGGEIKSVFVQGGKLLIGLDATDESCRLQRLKEGGIARVRRCNNGIRRGWQAMPLLYKLNEIQHLRPQIGWQCRYFRFNFA